MQERKTNIIKYDNSSQAFKKKLQNCKRPN